MVRARIFLYNFYRPLRSDDQKSTKLEYLSAGPNQPDAFTVSVNPLILSCLSLVLSSLNPWLIPPISRHS